jgi:hypothetical protein
MGDGTRVALNRQMIIHFFYREGNERHQLGTGFAYTRESYPEVKTRNQIDHVLIGRRQH